MNRSTYDNSTKEEVLDALEKAERELEEANGRADYAEGEISSLAIHMGAAEARADLVEDFNFMIRNISDLKRTGACYSALLDDLIYKVMGVIV